MKTENDKKIGEYRKKTIAKWTIIALYVVVIVLEILALFNVMSMLWGCALFAIVYLLKKNYLK